jgi:hypothetical protein
MNTNSAITLPQEVLSYSAVLGQACCNKFNKWHNRSQYINCHHDLKQCRYFLFLQKGSQFWNNQLWTFTLVSSPCSTYHTLKRWCKMSFQIDVLGNNCLEEPFDRLSLQKQRTYSKYWYKQYLFTFWTERLI